MMINYICESETNVWFSTQEGDKRGPQPSGQHGQAYPPTGPAPAGGATRGAAAPPGLPAPCPAPRHLTALAPSPGGAAACAHGDGLTQSP